LAKQTHLSAKRQHLIQSGKIGPQQLDALMPQSVLCTPPDPDGEYLISKQHCSDDTYLSQIIWDWGENIRKQSPNLEAMAVYRSEEVTGGPTLQFLFFVMENQIWTTTSRLFISF